MLRGSGDDYGTFDTLLEDLLRDALPEGLTLPDAVRRLLAALPVDAQRGLLADFAGSHGLHLGRVDAAAPRGAARVKALLAEVDDVAHGLRDAADEMERKGHAVIVESDDPGMAGAQTCTSCGASRIVTAAVRKFAAEKVPYSVVVFRNL